MVLPSGEKATEEMGPLWAFCLSILSSMVAANKGASQICKGGELKKASTCIPDFEGLVRRAGNDRLAIRGEVDAVDGAAVGVLLACLERQSVCKTRARSQI